MRDRLSAKSSERETEGESECVRGRHRGSRIAENSVQIQWQREIQRLECKEQRREKKKSRQMTRVLKRCKNTGLCDHLSCSHCASCCGWGAAGVQRTLLLWRNLTRPRKSSAAYSTQRSGLIASLAFPVTKSHPSATQGRDRDNRQLSPFLCLLLEKPLSL